MPDQAYGRLAFEDRPSRVDRQIIRPITYSHARASLLHLLEHIRRGNDDSGNALAFLAAWDTGASLTEIVIDPVLDMRSVYSITTLCRFITDHAVVVRPIAFGLGAEARRVCKTYFRRSRRSS